MLDASKNVTAVLWRSFSALSLWNLFIYFLFIVIFPGPTCATQGEEQIKETQLASTQIAHCYGGERK